MTTKNLLRRAFNRLLHLAARTGPGAATFRPFLHRMRGVKVGRHVWIGDDVYLENEYPERVELADGCILGIRATIIAHTRGPGHIVIERNASVGPGAVVVCVSGQTLRIGEGAVISIGAVVTKSVPPRMIVAPPRSLPVAKASISLSQAETIEEFIRGIEPLPPSGRQNGVVATTPEQQAAG